MKIEIRRSFTKDAEKLPAAFQQQLAAIIGRVEKAGQPNQLLIAKNSQVIKRLSG